jgi:thymidylate synthase
MMITNLSEQDSNLSQAWAKAFLITMERGGDTRHPSVVTINDLTDDVIPEDPAIRQLLDRELKRYGENSCATVSNTIFPLSIWNPNLAKDAESLFLRYEKAWRGIKKCPANKNGVYFRRLTAYQPKDRQDASVNQLQCVIDTYIGGNHRKSALQAAIFDPTRDHSNQPLRGFPCMQQVAFTPLPGNKLSITGIYATQLQFEKAYGNYLGLYWLGRFMAKHMNLTLTQVVCMAAVLHRSNNDVTKEKLTPFSNELRVLIK